MSASAAGSSARRASARSSTRRSIGYHLEQAYRYRIELGPVDDAAACARARGRRAARKRRAPRVRPQRRARRDEPDRSRAAALLPPDDPLRVELVPNVRVVQGLGARICAWADRVLTEAVEAAATTGDRRLAAHALVQRGLLRLFTESQVTADELIDAADRSIAVFDELGDELGLARAWRLKAQAHYLGSRAAACAEASERALVHVRRTDDRFEEQEIIEWLLIALLLGPAPAPRRLGDASACFVRQPGTSRFRRRSLRHSPPSRRCSGRWPKPMRSSSQQGGDGTRR